MFAVAERCKVGKEGGGESVGVSKGDVRDEERG